MMFAEGNVAHSSSGGSRITAPKAPVRDDEVAVARLDRGAKGAGPG